MMIKNNFMVRPKVDQTAGLLSLPHLGNFRRTATFTTCLNLVSIHLMATPLLNNATLPARLLLLIYRPRRGGGWVCLVGWPIADALPTKW